MKLQTLTAAVIATVLSANTFALAQKKGVVESVNLETNTITVSSYNGRVTDYKLSDQAKVIGADAIKVGQVVTLTLNTEEKPAYINAQILSVNSANGTAIVREKKSGNVRTITFAKDVAVKGRGIDSINKLAEGHIVKVRFAAK